MRVIRAARRHLDVIVPLFETYRQNNGQRPDPVAAEEFLSQRLRRSEAVIFLAQRNDEGQGFALLFPMFSAVDLRQEWLLTDIFIAPASRNDDNTAEELLQEAQRHVRKQGHKGILLEIERNHPVSPRVYQRLGFEEVSKFYRYWHV
jgi:ribosomal protein S18 acetylase RimI-like enzyme